MDGTKVKARKTHICSLCFKNIENGEVYCSERITPWDHPENEGFFQYKAHLACDELWVTAIGRDADWVFPSDKYEWAEYRGRE